MNTKNKIIAILMAGIVAMAVCVPMAMSAVSEATVNNKDPDVAITSTTPDSALPDDTVTIQGTLSDDNGLDDVTTRWCSIKDPDNIEVLNQTYAQTATWSITYAVPSSPKAGLYTVTAYAKDAGGLDDTAIDTFNVSTTMGIIVTAMGFGNVDPGVAKTGSHNVNNTGNVPIKFTESSTSGYNNDTDDGIKWINMTTAGAEIIPANSISVPTWSESSTIAPGANANIDFSLTAPLGTKAGDYSGTTTFSASQA